MTKRLLLDTCAIIWIAMDEVIKPEARAAMKAAFAADEKIRVSPISAWELGLLSCKDRLPATRTPLALFGEVVAATGVRIEPLSPEVLIESSFLPGNLHRDPADRILVATARAHDLTLMTRDRAILEYAKQGHVSALAC
ncbi:MAG: type II toxin-antitoxin system VapC family toxin [Hyphomicrobiales bacterium]|nr:type II toxin-antitoxin system VapC family toxin [Hyphomicrobiales bacterium]